MIKVFRKEDFCARLTALRIEKGVSARDMSLSLGQGAGYINNIENGHNLPSMEAFFDICEYLQITPDRFFSVDDPAPGRTDELLFSLRSLSSRQKEILLKLVELLKEKEK